MDSSSFAVYKAAIESAEGLFRTGQFEAAFKTYRDLLSKRLLESLPVGRGLENNADVVVVDRLVHLAVLFGYYDAADALLDGLASSSRNAGNLYLADYSTLKRVHLALSRGLTHTAEQCLLQLTEVIGDISKIEFTPQGLTAWENRCRWRGTDDSAARAVLFSSIYLAFGTLLAMLGQYRQARAALQRGQAHAGGEAPDLARCMVTPLRLASAAAALESGSLSEAGEILSSLHSNLDPISQPGYHTDWLEYSGRLHMLTGEFGDAVECFEEVVQLTEIHGFFQAEIMAMLNLAHIRILINQTASAMGLLDQARKKARALNDKANELRARFLWTVAQARGQSLADHVPIAPSATEMWNTGRKPLFSTMSEDIDPLSLPQLQSYLAFFEDRSLGVHWYLGHWDLDAANLLYEDMSTVFANTDSLLIQLRLRVLKGLVAYYRDDWASAETLFNATSSDARGMGLKPELWQLLRLLSWSRSRLKLPDAEIQEPAREADELLVEMVASLKGTHRAIFLLNKWTAEEEDLAREVDELRRLRMRYESVSWFKKPILYWSLLKGVGHLMWRVDRHKALATSRALSPESRLSETTVAKPSVMRRLLGRGRKHATIAFLVLPDRVLVMCARRLRLDFGISAITRLELRDLVKRWHMTISETNMSQEPIKQNNEQGVVNKTHTLREIAKHLGNALQLPSILARLPKHVTTLTIVPDDVLHGFPFATIDHNSNYLIERFAVTIGFESFQERSKPRPASPKKALLVGVAKGIETAPRLTGVRQELDKIAPIVAEWGWQIEELCDEAASKDTLLERLPGAGFFHIASHGIFQPEQPDLSGLILTSKGSRVEVFTLREIACLDLRSLRHATLSSCWSADNFVLPGRWIISLPETFYRAGAHSVLGSLWKVPDELAVDFMEQFYRYLGRHPRDRALQLVQIDCLRNALPGLADVRFWANFNLYGRRAFLKC
jgi:CHAT domain-containing protein/tetratricopeptide (TPR) repeat protein